MKNRILIGNYEVQLEIKKTDAIRACPYCGKENVLVLIVTNPKADSYKDAEILRKYLCVKTEGWGSKGCGRLFEVNMDI